MNKHIKNCWDCSTPLLFIEPNYDVAVLCPYCEDQWALSEELRESVEGNKSGDVTNL